MKKRFLITQVRRVCVIEMSGLKVFLDFFSNRRNLRRIIVSSESFEGALYLITPPSLRECGLPFVDNILTDKRYVREFWNLSSSDKLSTLVYTGGFLDELHVLVYVFLV
jgi:hypothetical protein